MNTERMDSLFQIWDLTKTINQALEHLKANPNNPQLLQDITDGIQALYSFCQNSPDTSSVLATCYTQIATFSETYSETGFLEKLNSCQEKTATSISFYIVNELTKELKDTPSLNADYANLFFNFWNEAPHNFPAAYLLMFFICNKCNKTAPQESFEYSLKLFEEVPAFLTGEHLPHPDYIYEALPQRTFDCCPICGNTGTPYFRALSYSMNSFEKPHLPVKLWMKCNHCQNLYTWKYPEKLLQLSTHSELILPDEQSHLNTFRTTVPNSFVLNIWSNILNKLRAYTNGTSLLEVGIGEGDLLAVALELGYDIDAVELFPTSATHVSNMLNLPIHCCDFLSYTTEKQYDIITMGDVIEHVTNPPLALQKANQLLKLDGILWLSTPNFESAFTRMIKFQDAMWNEPYHITYFSRRGFEKIAKDAGFEIIEHTISNRYNGSMELVLKKTLN